jgi:hypothetical protein
VLANQFSGNYSDPSTLNASGDFALLKKVLNQQFATTLVVYLFCGGFEHAAILR